jgi:LacI family transcriptional regulator, galactose operon repressor
MDDGFLQEAGPGRRRPTIADLAQAAGVSVATVDRVLNRRHPVREATARRVLEAAESLGYHATALLRSRVQEQAKPCRMGFLLQRESSPFYQQLAAHLEAAAASLAGPESRPLIEFVAELDAATIVECMRAMSRRVDALAVVSVDHPRVTEEIDRLRSHAIPTFTLLSDLSAPLRAGYIGLDARKAGRTAAWAISRLARRPGAVAIFVGSHRYLDHDTREISLRSYLREHAPDFNLLEPLVDLEQPPVAYDAALTLLRRHPELAGIYSAGGGTDGIIQALTEAGRAAEVILVCNELTPAIRSALIDRVVDLAIATPTAALAERAVRALLDAVRQASTAAPGQITLAFELYGPENI